MSLSPATLLPPNASPLERALEASTARAAAVDTSAAAKLWDPAACPLPLLPWLAWSLSVDQWDTAWPEATKRAAVADSIPLHRIKGTRAAVEAVLARFDALLYVVEWFERGLDPHTCEVRLPLVTAPGIAPGSERSSAVFAEIVLREVSKVKPLREHLTLVQEMRLTAAFGLQVAARVVGYVREFATLVTDTDPAWATYLQTENGEPIEAQGAGGYLEDTP